MNNLPIWNYPGTAPAFNDTESLTVLEATAKVYAAARELITEYNEFSTSLKKEIEEYKNSETTAREEFERKIVCMIDGFNRAINEKIKQQDAVIANELPSIATDIINAAITDGRIIIREVYDPETESLNLNVTGGV